MKFWEHIRLNLRRPSFRHPGERRDPWMRSADGVRSTDVILSMGPGVRRDDGSLLNGSMSEMPTL
jgi:hypothetical protein